MPIFEMPIKLSSYQFTHDRDFESVVYEFNTQHTTERESLKMWSFEYSNLDEEAGIFGGTLTIDTDGPFDSTEPGEDHFVGFADKLEAALVAGLQVCDSTFSRWLGGLQSRPRRLDEPIVVHVTREEFLGEYGDSEDGGPDYIPIR